jgi:hypothetical protein
MNNTCGIAGGIDKHDPTGRAICGRPAVDWIDVPTAEGGSIRVYFCVDHLHHREQLAATYSIALLDDTFEEEPFND